MAQSSMPYSSYFLDGVSQNHKINAAFMPNHGYFSVIPVLSGLNFTVATDDMGVGTFFYPSKTNSDEINTFLHPDVSSDEFLKNVNDLQSFDFQVDMTILSVGFFNWGGFNTFDLSLKSVGNLTVAGDLFEFMKVGQSSSTTNYDLSGTSLYTTSYGEVAFGHSRPINDKLTVGMKFKYLLGGMSAKVMCDQFDISLSEDVWNINSQINGNVSMAGSTVDFSDEADDIFSVDSGDLGISGSGLAFDFGATYRFYDWLEASMSINDLGFIKWKNGNTKLSSSESEFEYSGFEDLDIDDMDIDDQLDSMTEDLEELFDLEAESNAASYRERLTTDINIGAEFFYPNQKYSAGLVYTMHLMHGQVQHRGMLALNLKMLSWFNLAGTYSLSNYGSNVGGLISFCPKGFNFYMGMDYGLPKMTTSFMPVESSFGLNFNMGLNFTFGKANPYKYEI